ncbi:sigma-70 family RNA polymerase sigma factor [Brachybacterium sp. YJGR34]|uniref:sigma-70 family RNA polymerase sigma factor n=1 Tax=Brachybacterium sp. YJGR34 TaxID=2059911 RepID=UPI000E0BA4E7|nr:sigma-70 family RNA polymerase sigma factor [Brachybacterium sp. YJGR34]
MQERTLAEAFEQERPRLLAVAARALGSRDDAEDAVQEAWLRLDRHRGDRIENLAGWLTRVVGRICLDTLRRRTAQAETALEDWETDPVVTEDVEDPQDTALTADAVGLAMLVVLDSLTPSERLAFVLHDVFAVPFAQIAEIIDTTPGAAKMAASRARRTLQQQPVPTGSLHQRREVVDAFLAAAREGNFEALLTLLDPDVTWHRLTARRRTTGAGAESVLDAVRRGDPSRMQARRVSVDGEPGILVWGPNGRPMGLMACTVADGRIVALTSIIDPARLARMELPDPESH